MNERFDDDEEEEVENDVKKQQRLFHGRRARIAIGVFVASTKSCFLL